MTPENIFRYEKKLAKYYKYWMSDLNEISPNYYINEVERDPDLVDAILYFSSKSKQTKSIKLITLYCKMTKGENINMDEVKNLIDSSKLDKYRYYNYFGIKYHFDPKRSHSMEAENIIPEKIKLDNTSTYSINSCMRVLTNCEVTLQYNSDFLISSINEHYKIQGGKIVKKASFNSNAHVLRGIIDPIIDKLTSKSRKIAFVDGVEFPIKYKTTISYNTRHMFANLKTADVDVIINK